MLIRIRNTKIKRLLNSAAKALFESSFADPDPVFSRHLKKNNCVTNLKQIPSQINVMPPYCEVSPVNPVLKAGTF